MPRRTIPVRNPVAQSPLLRKGGPHVQSKTGQRVRARLSTHSAVDEWLGEREKDEHNYKQQDGEPMLPDFLYASSAVAKEITLFRRLGL